MDVLKSVVSHWLQKGHHPQMFDFSNVLKYLRDYMYTKTHRHTNTPRNISHVLIWEKT